MCIDEHQRYSTIQTAAEKEKNNQHSGCCAGEKKWDQTIYNIFMWFLMEQFYIKPTTECFLYHPGFPVESE